MGLVDRNTPYAEDDPELWKVLHQEADAFVYLGAASSSTTAYAFKWSAGLEKSGLPGAVVMYDTLLNVAQSVREREGVPVRYAAFGYPLGLLTPQALQQRTDEVIAALVNPLTAEEQRTGAVAREATPEIMFSGTLDEVQAYFHENRLSDGLPIVPPTRARVDAMLKGTSHPRDKVLTTKMPPQELTVTVEKVAIIGVMAGCDPSHMPVLLASFEAFMHQDRNAIIRSTNSFGFMQVVNGPIRRELEMNAGAQLLAPGNHANASIGRALRLFITNLGGGEPGVNLMGVIGTLANWPFLFAEFEEENPWESLAVS